MISTELLKSLERVDGEVSLYLKARNRRERIWRSYHRVIGQSKRILQRAVNRYLKEIRVRSEPYLRRVKRADAASFAENIVQWEELEAYGVGILKPALLEILAIGGRGVIETGVLKAEKPVFDIIRIASVKYAEKKAAELITLVSQNTKEAIKTIVARGLKENETVAEIARAIRPYIGLNAQQASSLARQISETIQAHPEWADAKVQSALDRVGTRLLNRRAETIARTETASALSEGIVQGYGDLGVKQVEWVADMDPVECCDYCQDQNGQVYSLEEASGMIPAHPNCECTWVEYYQEEKTQ